MVRIDKPYGYVEWDDRDHRVAEICDIVVTDKKERGKGYGPKLIEEAIKQMRKKKLRYCYVFTELNNPVAQRFYERRGFSRIGELPAMYSGT